MKPQPLLIVTALVLALSGPLRAADLTPYQQMGREIYKELIETDTTHSKGDTTKAAELLAKLEGAMLVANALGDIALFDRATGELV